jgi:hypothetical protein
VRALTILAFVLAFVASIALLFVFLNWLTARTYRPTKTDVLNVLDSVLSGTVSYLAWDTFICVPMRHDRELETVRAQCSALDQDKSLFAGMGKERRGHAGFNALGLQRIREIRNRLAGGSSA